MTDYRNPVFQDVHDPYRDLNNPFRSHFTLAELSESALAWTAIFGIIFVMGLMIYVISGRNLQTSQFYQPLPPFANHMELAPASPFLPSQRLPSPGIQSSTPSAPVR
jgi:hypothetical protein